MANELTERFSFRFCMIIRFHMIRPTKYKVCLSLFSPLNKPFFSILLGSAAVDPLR